MDLYNGETKLVDTLEKPQSL